MGKTRIDMAVPIAGYEHEGKYHFTCPCCGLTHVVEEGEADELMTKWGENMSAFIELIVEMYDNGQKN